jgi:hypothetical protein
MDRHDTGRRGRRWHARRHKPRTGRRDEVEEHRDRLRGLETGGRHEREVRQETAQGRARRVDAIEKRDPPSRDLDIASNGMPNEQSQRAAHQHRDRRQQEDGDPSAGQIGRR